MPEPKPDSQTHGPSLATCLDLWNLLLILVGVTIVLLLYKF
jgi:hypothetical protein